MSDAEDSPLLRAQEDARELSGPEGPIPEDLLSVENNVKPEDSTLGRKIGWSSAYILVISRVIGSGIFAMPGSVVQTVGSLGLALTLWIIGAAVAWCGLAIDLEYGCMLPRSGGVKVYLEYTFRKPRFLASTMVAVQAVVLGFTASNCIVFAKYTMFAFDIVPNDLTTKLLAVGLLTAITIVHSCFLKTGIFIQNALGWIKIALVIFTCATGIFVLFRGVQESSSPVIQSAWIDMWADSNWEFNNLSTAFFKVAYSYAGLNNINNVLNEVRNPVRTLKSVGPIALITACILYLSINFAYFAVVPLEEIKSSRELIAALFFERLGFGRWFLPIGIALSAAGNVMVVTFSLARLNQEVARQGFLPYASLLASNRPFNAPMGGLIVHYVPSLLVIVLPPSTTVYAFIADTEGYAGQFFAFAVGAGLLLLRVRKPDLVRPYKAWIPAIWLRLLLCILLIAAPLFPPKSGEGDVDFFYASYALVGVGILLFAVVYWWVWTIVWPRYRGYRLEEVIDVLEDGTTVTRLERCPT